MADSRLTDWGRFSSRSLVSFLSLSLSLSLFLSHFFIEFMCGHRSSWGPILRQDRHFRPPPLKKKQSTASRWHLGRCQRIHRRSRVIIYDLTADKQRNRERGATLSDTDRERERERERAALPPIVGRRWRRTHLNAAR